MSLELLTGIELYLYDVFVTFLRIGPILLFMPGYSEAFVPVRVKLVLSIVLSILVSSAISGGAQVENYPKFFLSETVVGIALGCYLRTFTWALQISATMAAQSTSLAQLLGGDSVAPMPAIGQLLHIAGISAFVTFGLHFQAINFLIQSFEVFPPGTIGDLSDFAGMSVDRMSMLFTTALGFSAPFVALSLIYNVTLGVINRAMPQLMVAFIGAPLITLAALAMLFMSAPHIISTWINLIKGSLGF